MPPTHGHHVTTPPTRVLVQVNSLQLGGTQLNALDLAVAVREHGFESVLFGPDRSLPRDGASLLDVAKDRGVNIQSYPVQPSVLAGGAKEFARRAKRSAPDLVHVYGTWAGERSAYWGPCLLGQRPLVHTVYEMVVHPQVYRHTTLIVGTGYLLDEFRDRPGLTELISPPVDLDRDAPESVDTQGFLENIGSEPGRVRIGLVSRLDEKMKALSVEAAIDAVTALDDPNVELLVAGSGDAFPRLARLAEARNMALGRPAIRLLGAMSDPRPVYASASLVLGMGSSAARALAFGRPLIVQGELGTSEIFSKESAVSLYRRSFWNDSPNADPAGQLARHIRTTLSQLGDRSLGSYARVFAERHFGLAAMAERLAATYEKAMRTYGIRGWAADLGLERRAFLRQPPFHSDAPRAWARGPKGRLPLPAPVPAPLEHSLRPDRRG